MIGQEETMLISQKIRLEVTPQDAGTLEFMWRVPRLQGGEKWPGWEEAKKTLQASGRKGA
jgi:hypothetical protein